MNIKESVKYVGKRFVYEKDPKVWGDTWHILKLKDGKFKGDCDDFALTCFWYFSNKSIIKFLFHLIITHKYKLYRCKDINNEWHVVGCIENLWFDNWTKEALPKEDFFSRTKHTIKMRYFSFMFIWFLIIGVFE